MRTRRSSSSPFSLFAFQDIITSVIAIVILITLILTLEIVNRVSQSPQNAKVTTEEDIRSATDRIKIIKQEISKLKGKITAAAPILPKQPIVSPTEIKKQIERLTRHLETLNRKVSSIGNGPVKPALPVKQLLALETKLKATKEKITHLQSNSTVIYVPDTNSKRTCWVIQFEKKQIKLLPITHGLPTKTLRGDNNKQLLERLQQDLKLLANDEHYFLFTARPTSDPDLYFQILDLLEKKKYPVGVELIPEDVQIITQSNLDKMF